MSEGNNDPFYLEIANQLREQLLSGKFKPGQRFHSIRGLIKETQRSLPTVRSALALLIKENLLEARQGSGYYVTSKVESHADRSRGFLNFLAVIPWSSEPDEPWFTGKISLGMINAANFDHAVVSFYKRQAPGNSASDRAKIDLDRIAAMKPDGVVWLHNSTADALVLRELQDRGVPIVTTMRRIPGVEVPLIREDDTVYASMVLSNFEARGHRRIGFIARSLDDDYFRAKVEAFKDVAASSSIQFGNDDIFFMSQSDPEGLHQAESLRAFLEARKDLTGLMVLASTGIKPLIQLYDTPVHERLRRLSVIFNVLDGVPVPTLPGGENLATIYPPLEKLGEHLIHFLTGLVSGAPDSPPRRLIPIFQKGDSLKLA